MSQVVNTRQVSAQSGCLRAIFLAEAIGTGIAGIFSVKISVPERGISYSIGYLKGRTPESAQYNTCNGDVGGTVKGNKSFETKDLSMTFGDEYNQLNEIDPTIARQLLIAVYLGGTFEYGGVKYTLLGTNGTRNIVSKSDNNDFKYLFTKEGEVITPDVKDANFNMDTQDNGFIGTYNENNPIAMEFLYAYSQTEKKGDRFVYVLASDITFNEGDGSQNTYGVDMMRCSDYRAIDKYLVNGVTDPETLATSGTDSLYRIDADIVIEVASGGIPTVAGVAGDQAVVIDTADNTVELYLHDGTDWGTTAAVVTSVLGQGAIIYTRAHDTALDGATAEDENVIVGIKTAGATGVAVAVDSKTNTAGSGASSCVWNLYDWSYANQDFIVASGEVE